MAEALKPATNAEELAERMSLKYGDEDARSLKRMEFHIFLREFGNFFAHPELRALDLGCGSGRMSDKWENRTCEPWWCRVLYECGINRIVGIDIDDNSGEPFEWYQADLRRRESLLFLENASFDVVNNQHLLPPAAPGSPLFNGYVSPKLRRLSCNFLGILSLRKLKKMQLFLRREVERVLTENGVYLWQDDVYRKIQGKLQHQYNIFGKGKLE